MKTVGYNLAAMENSSFSKAKIKVEGCHLALEREIFGKKGKKSPALPCRMKPYKALSDRESGT